MKERVHAEPARAWQSPVRRNWDSYTNICHGFATQIY